MKQLNNQAFKLLNSRFGDKAQIIKAIEELSELQQVLCHYLNKDVKDGSHMETDLLDIATEITDVRIVTEFLIRIFDIGDLVDRERKRKLMRVINNLK